MSEISAINTLSTQWSSLKKSVEESSDDDTTSGAVSFISQSMTDSLRIFSTAFTFGNLDSSVDQVDRFTDKFDDFLKRLGKSGSSLSPAEDAIVKKIEDLLSDGIDSSDELNKITGLLKKLGSKAPPKLRKQVFKETKDFFKKLAHKAETGEISPDKAQKELENCKVCMGGLMGAYLEELKRLLIDSMTDLANDQFKIKDTEKKRA